MVLLLIWIPQQAELIQLSFMLTNQESYRQGGGLLAESRSYFSKWRE
jgi:hypothetical protein